MKSFNLFSIISIWLYVSFMLDNSTIRKKIDTHHLNIVCILSYFDQFLFFALFPLQHICYYFNQPTSYRWTLPLSILWYLFFFVLTNDKPRLLTVVIWFHHTLRQQYRKTLRLRDLHKQRWVQFIDIHTSVLFLTHQKHIQNKKGDCFYSPTLIWNLCVILFSSYSI